MSVGTNPPPADAVGHKQQWLTEEYERLKARAAPVLADHSRLAALVRQRELVADQLAREAYGLLLALGWTESQALKEVKTWRKPAE